MKDRISMNSMTIVHRLIPMATTVNTRKLVKTKQNEWGNLSPEPVIFLNGKANRVRQSNVVMEIPELSPTDPMYTAPANAIPV